MARIGAQTMMLKDAFTERGVFATLSVLREIGYRVIEVSALPMTPENVAELDRAREELGIEIAALSSGLVDSDLDFEQLVADAKCLDARMIRMGALPFPAMESLATVHAFCDRADELAIRLGEHGIGFFYHNHHLDFAKYDGDYLLDIIAERAPHVGFELDVHWVQRAGQDPVATLRKYADRLALVHLKDFRIGRIPPNVFDDARTGVADAVPNAFAAMTQFAEVGEGNLDFTAIVNESLSIGAQYLLVEQDETYGRSALDCLRTSHDNLVALGFGHLF